MKHDQNLRTVIAPGTRIAVTGSRGFIGHRLVQALRSQGHTVNPLVGDVTSPKTWEGEFDILYHLAAAMPKIYAQDPGRGYSVNVCGVINALEACRLRSAKIVFPSTCGLYRDQISDSVSEDHPLQDQTPYATQKLVGEMLCRAYAAHHKVRCVILRLFNVYGGGQKPQFLIPYLFQCAFTGSMALIKTPDSRRDLIHVDDVVAAMLAAAGVDTEYALLNIGSGSSHSVREIISFVQEIVGQPLSWKHVAGSTDVHQGIRADISAARAGLMRWYPRVRIQEGLAETGDYVKRSLEAIDGTNGWVRNC